MPEHADNLPASDLHRLLAELHTESWGWALRCCHGHRHTAEDVLQRSYQKILSGRARFSGSSSFKTWLFGVIRFTALDERRGLLRRWLRFLPFPESDSPASANTHAFPGSSSASSNASAFATLPSPLSGDDDTARAQSLRTALSQLAPRQAEALHLVFYHDLTLDEAAAVMRVSPGTARTHYERGKAALRQLLSPSDLHP